ncbi:MIEF1 upstream open reading frame protein [Lutzomyia longipalpis]|uniref:MIEF1 upstream open reading frame protein n=1 Tax=Lutzomyia longipalpis TaxID=7200 RepID=UPI0024839001|nr:MIEF1 upstream open reading frame protein [Lutzomyia longipalpis]
MSAPGAPSCRQVLNLYRQLLRYGERLKLTDKEYFKQRIRKEFQQNRDLTSPEDILFNFKKGEIVLQNARVI